MVKKTIITLIVIFLLIIPFPMPGKTGAYNKISETFWCIDRIACIHEIGHKLDDEGGWISHSNDFSLAVSAFVWYEISEKENPHPYVYKIMSFPGTFRYVPFWVDSNSELYASLLEWSEGKQENMPFSFRRFYDWERAAELIEKVLR